MTRDAQLDGSWKRWITGWTMEKMDEGMGSSIGYGEFKIRKVEKEK